LFYKRNTKLEIIIMDKKYNWKIFKIKVEIFLISLLLSSAMVLNGQIQCKPAASSFVFTPTPVNQIRLIDWDKFPEFTLPFSIVYNGPRFGDNKQQPLKHGFSHLSNYSGADSATLPVKNRALIYYGVAYLFQNPQPWQLIRSPWGNDMDGYRRKWRGEMAAYASHFNDTKGTPSPAADLLILDIERHWEGEFLLATDLAILAMKNDPTLPAQYSKLPDKQFVETYKKDMLKLYAEPLTYMKNNGLLTKFNKISSYGDVPIKFQGLNIEANQWADWQTNKDRLSYIMKDTSNIQFGGPFYNQLDFLCPSAYVQAEYGANPKAKGGNYLSEVLFQIEVNKAWSKKEIWPFIWLRYEDFSLQYPRFVKPFQAEALAIFPFMAGAKGAILWEDAFDPIDINYTTYEYYINGLYRLSLYKSFFEGANEFVQIENARDLNANQLPIWRGVVKDNKILVAANNPYAADNEVTKMEVRYKKWNTTIVLKGKETFLCAFDLFDITENEPLIDIYRFKILDNPLSQNKIRFEMQLSKNQQFEVSMMSNKGERIFKSTFNGINGYHTYETNLNSLPKGVYTIEIKLEKGNIIKKIVN
jgi:hypothetical protein